MAALAEHVTRATTFVLAVFLWIHALFFLNVQSTVISGSTRLLRLTSSEVVLLALLLVFSILGASGFWKSLGSLAYIYFFPFVLLMYVLYCCFLLLRAMHRWFKAQANPQLGGAPAVEQKTLAIPAVTPASSGSPVGAKKRAAELLRLLARPFQRFTLLWCMLLLITTHVAIVWLCLIVVLVHLVRKIFLILKILLFSDPWLRKIGAGVLTNLNNSFAGLAAVTRDASPTNELRNLRNQISAWRKILDFLRDPYLLSSWAWVLGIAFLGSIYTYIAILFSFAYYGIARVGGLSYSWPDALVASLFIPFFVSELPKILAIGLLGGIHCSLVVVVGVGTIMNFLSRKLDAVRVAATDLSERLAGQSIQEKYLILDEKFSTIATPSLPAGDTKN